ncbi:MAG: hypothetical protein AABX07_00850 [Nanoarchaeota archaeon]
MSNLYQPVKISKHQRTIRSIRTLAKQGKTRQEIAVKLQLTYGTVSYYSVKEGIDIQKMPRGRKGADILLIKQELKKGKRLFFIADELKLTGCSLYRVLIKTEISTRQPALSELEIKTLQDSLRTMDDKTRKVVQGVLESKSQTTIADDTGLTKECTRQYIEGLGLYNTWRAKRNEPYNLRTKTVSLLQQRIEQLINSPELSWAEKKAYEYNLNSRFGTTKRAIPHKKLVKLFTMYEKVKEQGKKHSLEWFAQRVGFSTQGEVGIIFSRSSILPLHGNREFERVSEEKSSALKKAGKLGYLNLSDIAYFSGLSDTAIERHTLPTSKKNTAIKRFRDSNRLTFSKASQIYQAHDLGFSLRQTILVCDILPEIVAYAEHWRSSIAPKIVKAIKTLYPREKVKVPYINFDNRESKYK